MIFCYTDGKLIQMSLTDNFILIQNNTHLYQRTTMRTYKFTEVDLLLNNTN